MDLSTPNSDPNTVHSALRSTESNAFARSTNAAYNTFPFALLHYAKAYITTLLSSVRCPSRNPLYPMALRSLSLASYVNLASSTLAYTFAIVEVTAIPL
jgi:hypothetical protein